MLVNFVTTLQTFNVYKSRKRETQSVKKIKDGNYEKNKAFKVL